MEAIEIENLLQGETSLKKSYSLDKKKMLYNCSKCKSPIEIISMDEEFIEFKCNNKHNNKMKIKDYLEEMKQYNNYALNSDRCENHHIKYLSYCFECNSHLCEECLKSGDHVYHYKIDIIEIMPDKESLNKINKIINDNKIKLKKLAASKLNTKKQLNNILIKNINKINQTKENKKNYDEELKNELELNRNSYINSMKELKKEYENKMKEIKLKYNENINNIRNKYKLLNGINEKIYNNKINTLKKCFEKKIDGYKFKERMEKLSNFNKFIEIAFNTFINFENNYFNSKNLKFIYNEYFNIKNKLEEKHAAMKNLIQKYNNQNKTKISKRIKKDKELEINKIKTLNIKNINFDNKDRIKIKMEKKPEYKFTFLCDNKINIRKGFKFLDIPIRFKNTGPLPWPKNTKLIFDKKFEVKGKNIFLEPLKPDEEQITFLRIDNLQNFKEGIYKTGVWINADGINYYLINFEIVIEKQGKKFNEKTFEIIKQFRKEFNLSEVEYTNEFLFDQLRKCGCDFAMTFSSIFAD